MQTLREIFRTLGQRPFVAEREGGRRFQFLGFGPNGKIIGWALGDDKIQEIDADQRRWQFRASF